MTVSALSSDTSPPGEVMGFSESFVLRRLFWAHSDRGSLRRFSRWKLRIRRSSIRSSPGRAMIYLPG